MSSFDSFSQKLMLFEDENFYHNFSDQNYWNVLSENENDLLLLMHTNQCNFSQLHQHVFQPCLNQPIQVEIDRVTKEEELIDSESQTQVSQNKAMTQNDQNKKSLSYQCLKKQKKIKKKESKGKIFYNTHNFLTPVMKIHLKYIYKNFKQDFNKFQVIRKLFQKFNIIQNFKEKKSKYSISKSQKQDKMQNSTNMAQFNDLYNIRQLEELFNQFFEDKILYRELLISRINQKSRNAFFQNIKVFQKNYKKKQFKVTNLAAKVKQIKGVDKNRHSFSTQSSD